MIRATSTAANFVSITSSSHPGIQIGIASITSTTERTQTTTRKRPHANLLLPPQDAPRKDSHPREEHRAAPRLNP